LRQGLVDIRAVDVTTLEGAALIFRDDLVAIVDEPRGRAAGCFADASSQGVVFVSACGEAGSGAGAGEAVLEVPGQCLAGAGRRQVSLGVVAPRSLKLSPSERATRPPESMPTPAAATAPETHAPEPPATSTPVYLFRTHVLRMQRRASHREEEARNALHFWRFLREPAQFLEA